jgi:hypothetical protein
MQITGTFLDEITHDIPSQNWGPQEWAADFAAMRHIGIDTVVLIRAGYRERAVFESAVLNRHRAMMPVREDLGQMFLDLAAANGMRLFWGLYDPGDWADRGAEALAVNVAFCGEVFDRFGRHPGFGGWYLSFELSRDDPRQIDLVLGAGRHVKVVSPDLPVLISPYMAGVKAPSGEAAISRDQYESEWSAIFQRVAEVVNIVAFQDGHVDYLELPDYLRANVRLAREHGIACWSNVETFDRDMPIRFPPIDWRKLDYKTRVATAAGVEKLITFEFSHFLSPHSSYPAAHHLFRRYCERHGLGDFTGGR